MSTCGSSNTLFISFIGPQGIPDPSKKSIHSSVVLSANLFGGRERLIKSETAERLEKTPLCFVEKKMKQQLLNSSNVRFFPGFAKNLKRGFELKKGALSTKLWIGYAISNVAQRRFLALSSALRSFFLSPISRATCVRLCKLET